MPDCNIRNIDADLMRDMKARAASKGLTLRDWVIAQIRIGLAPDHFTPKMKQEYRKDSEFLEGTDWSVVTDAPLVYESARVTAADSLIALSEATHNLKTCRVYRCAQCVALGKKF